MSTMQAFYLRLHAAQEADDSYLQALARLAEASLTEVAALQSDLSWEPWGESAVATPA